MNNTSFDKIIDNVFDSLKKLSPALVAILIASSFLLFAPEKLLTKIHLNNLGDVFKTVCGFAFLISLSLIISIIMFSIVGSVKKRKHMKNMEKIILELTPSEKTLILLMYFSPAHSMSMSLQEGITGALLQKNIISLASSVGDNVGVFTFPCVLQPWVVRYLSSHPEILNTMSEKQIQNLINDHYRRLSQIF